MGKIELTTEQRAALEAGDVAAEEVREAIEKLRDIGVDVRDLEKNYQETERMRQGLLSHF